MASYKVYIDNRMWGRFESNTSKVKFQHEMQECLNTLHPINMSEENAIQYRKRFENSKVYVYNIDEPVKHI